MLCIIPAKSTSQRLPGKNMKLLNGKEMYKYSVEAALESGVFTNIVVSTEDSRLAQAASGCGTKGTEYHQYKTQLFGVTRDEELASDTTTVFEVCKDFIEDNMGGFHFEDEDFAVLLPTSPLRSAQDIKDAYKTFKGSGAECLFSVSRFEYPPQWALCGDNDEIGLFPFASEGVFNTKRQELTPLYRHDGSVIMCNTKAFLKASDWLDMDTVPFFTAPERAIDINSAMDFKFAEFLLKGENDKR